MYPWGSNHRFTGTQQAEYDSLDHKGRRMYDSLRWNEDYDHEDAVHEAYMFHGQNRYYVKYDLARDEAENVLASKPWWGVDTPV